MVNVYRFIFCFEIKQNSETVACKTGVCDDVNCDDLIPSIKCQD